MKHNLDGTTTKTSHLDQSWLKLSLWRDEYEITKPTDTVENYKLGELKSALLVRIRIPANFIVWFYKLRSIAKC